MSADWRGGIGDRVPSRRGNGWSLLAGRAFAYASFACFDPVGIVYVPVHNGVVMGAVVMGLESRTRCTMHKVE